MNDVPSIKNVQLDGDAVLWKAADLDRGYSVDLTVIDESTPVIMKGYAAVPKRGAEVGGLLLGSVQPDRTTRITAFIPVDVEYAYGPSFQLSQRDRRLFEGKLMAMRAAGRIVVGLYRSNTREEFQLAQTDFELFNQFFTDPGAVFLLVQPSMTKIPYAAMFAQPHVAANQLEPKNQFPFRRKELGAPPPPPPKRGDTGAFKPAAEPDPAATGRFNRTGQFSRTHPNEAAEPATGGPSIPYQTADAKPTNLNLPALMAYFLVAIVGLGLGGVVGYQRGLKSGMGQDFTVAYQVPVRLQRKGAQLLVQWPANSAAVRSADAGMLFLESGRKPTAVVLTREQLLSGEAIYSEQVSRMNGRLELRYEGGADSCEPILISQCREPNSAVRIASRASV